VLDLLTTSMTLLDDIYLAGTEWKLYSKYKEVDWDFSHLEADIGTGDLSKEQREGKQLYVFGASEPQLLEIENGPPTVFHIPVLTAVISDVAPPDLLGIKSVQRAQEDVVPMRALNMYWDPFFLPDRPSDGKHKTAAVKDKSVGEVNGAGKGATKKRKHVVEPDAFFLKCKLRSASLKVMNEEGTARYEYCLPYIFRPEQARKELEDVETSVTVILTLENQPITLDFDWEMDDLADILQEVKETYELKEASSLEELKSKIQEDVRNLKLKNKALKDKVAAKINALSPAEQESLKTMKLVKYYPLNKKPNFDNFKTKFTNRYYGNAQDVRPAIITQTMDYTTLWKK
jgi:hypothetical protein